jgi:ribosomal protein L11 methyltransferase
VCSEQAEIVLAELLELAPAGVEEVQLGPETVEYAVYGAPGELPSLPALTAAVGGALVDISTTETADDWGERWKRFHRPVLIRAPLREPHRPSRSGSRSKPDSERQVPDLRVRPPWEAASDTRSGTVEEIVIDPGQAFGTGAHATTRLCLELLLELAALERPAGPLLDVGTGSGVLAIAAARLGFAPVLGLDHERESVAAARENALANGVEIVVRHYDLHAQAPPWPRAAGASAASTVVLANLLRPLLLELAGALPLAPAHLLAGGLLLEQCDEVAHAFGERLGMRERDRRESGEWAALWLTAP